MSAAPERLGTARLLARHSLRPDTDLGQHFLLDENLADLAVRMGAVGPDDVVLEVGAGVGTLTVPLARAAGVVHAVELDRRLMPALEEAVGGDPRVRLVVADAMRMDLEALAPPPTRMVSNLPYHVATPLVVETLWRLPGVERWAVMVQREVADRWLAGPGSRLYGGPSVLIQLATEPTARRAVGREVFTPRPRVDSALVALRRVAPGPPPAVRTLVRAAFATRRKTLVNALGATGADRDAVRAALGDLGLAAAARAEDLPPAAYPLLAEALSWPA